MTAEPQDTSDDDVWMSDEQAHALFERAAREELGMSGEEFLRRWDAGEWRDTWDDIPAVRSVQMMIPLVRRIPA